jgi:ribose 5-phosphate isomerase B
VNKVRKEWKPAISRGTVTNFEANNKIMRRIHLGCDHAGFELKQYLKDALLVLGYEIVDHGAHSSESVDYPDFAHPLAKAVEAELGVGVLVCGSANGVAMAANKHQGIRAAICWNKEVTELARLHNDANVLCLPARFIAKELASEMVILFLNTSFEGGRHQNRVSKIACI